MTERYVFSLRGPLDSLAVILHGLYHLEVPLEVLHTSTCLERDIFYLLLRFPDRLGIDNLRNFLSQVVGLDTVSIR